MQKGFFITGTDTGVGKTVITGAIIKAMRSRGIDACAMKPIETGCLRVGNILYPSDGMFLKGIAVMDDDIKHITPYCFEKPVAPFVASEMEGTGIDIDVIGNEFKYLMKKYGSVVVEGIGGILVPIKKDYFVIDLIKQLEQPLIVVSKPSLGTINHTLLTIDYALKKGIKVAGIIINFSRPQDNSTAEQTNKAVLQQISPVPVIGTFPHIENIECKALESAALKFLDIEALLNIPVS